MRRIVSREGQLASEKHDRWLKCSWRRSAHLLKYPTAPTPSPQAHTHAYTEKNKSEFQVTIQSILSQSAIIGWRRMAGEQKSIGQQGWRRPNWRQLKLQHRCMNSGLPPQLLWKRTCIVPFSSFLLSWENERISGVLKWFAGIWRTGVTSPLEVCGSLKGIFAKVWLLTKTVKFWITLEVIWKIAFLCLSVPVSNYVRLTLTR